MTEEEIINLLTIAAAFDNRKPSQGAVHAWADSADRGRWTFQEASEAIKDYYARTTDEKPWVMPSHITARIRVVREDREMRTAALELTAPQDPRVIQAVDQVARRLAIPEQFRPTEDRAAVMSVSCPHCGAAVGSPCTRPSPGGARDTNPHPSRREAAGLEVS